MANKKLIIEEEGDEMKSWPEEKVTADAEVSDKKEIATDSANPRNDKEEETLNQQDDDSHLEKRELKGDADVKNTKELTTEPGKENRPLKSEGFTIKLTKKGLIITGIVVGILLLAAAIWQFKWYQPVVNRFNRGGITIKVKEDDKYVLPGVSLIATANIQGQNIIVGSTSSTTNENGSLTLNSMLAGQYHLLATKVGYKDLETDFTIKRGDNGPLNISMTKQTEKLYTIKGSFVDYVSGLPVADVQVGIGSKTMISSPTGEFLIDQKVVGSYTLDISKNQYLDQALPAEIKDVNLDLGKVVIVPAGKIIFVSNRDGKKAIYSSNYDGSAQKSLIENKAGAEYYAPNMSPDKKWVVYASTEDKLKNSYGSDLAKLYIIGIDGKNGRKISDEVNSEFNVNWSQDSKKFYYTGYTDTKMEKAVYKVYDIDKSTAYDLGDQVSQFVFSKDGSLGIYTMSEQEDRVTQIPSVTYAPTTSGMTTPIPTTVPQTNKVTVYKVKTFNFSTGERKELVKKDQYFDFVQLSSDGLSVGYDIYLNNAKHRYEIPVTGGDEKEVALLSYTQRSYNVAPTSSVKAYQGWKAFVEKRDGKSDLYIVDSADKNEKKLTTLGTVTQYMPVEWDNSGRYITFSISREGETAIYIVSLDGGDAKKVADYFEYSGGSFQ